jgi:hypothetical protein
LLRPIHGILLFNGLSVPSIRFAGALGKLGMVMKRQLPLRRKRENGDALINNADAASTQSSIATDLDFSQDTILSCATASAI